MWAVAKSLRREPVGSSEQEGGLSDASELQHQHDDPCKTHTKPAVRGNTVTEKVEVVVKVSKVHLLVFGLCF